MITVAQAAKQMIDYYKGNREDINHFLKVWSYAKTIAEMEEIDKDTQYILELAAVTHDIACPLCREKYGNTNGKYQEAESDPLIREFYAQAGLSEAQLDRISFLLCHHHTYVDVDGIDYQILLEADYLVNADEQHIAEDAIRKFEQKVFKTKTGKQLLESCFANANI